MGADSVARITPWSWQPDRTPFLSTLADAAAGWTPSVDTSSSPADVAAAVKRSVAENAQWLLHPCMSALTHAADLGRAERDIALLGWLCANADLAGEVRIEGPTWCWTATGGTFLDTGTHDLGKIAAAMVEGNAPEIAFDPWCTILGYPHADSVPTSDMSDEEQEAAVRRSVLVGLRGLQFLRGFLPDVADWLTSYTKVLVFLDGAGNVSRSSSAEDLPGIVFADAISELPLLEVVIHETAHQVLYLEEAGGPLIDPDETRLFTSPLRPDPRPLRGILLAYHALAYICAFYADLQRAMEQQDVVDESDLADLRSKAAEAAVTVEEAASGLTPRGLAFVERTRDVLRYAD